MSDAGNATEPLSRDDLLAHLRALAAVEDSEMAHYDADNLLLDYINDEEVNEAFRAIGRWYA